MEAPQRVRALSVEERSCTPEYAENVSPRPSSFRATSPQSTPRVRAMQNRACSAASATFADEEEDVLVPGSVAHAAWMFAGLLMIVGCRGDTTRPREVAPTPKVVPT